MNAIAGTALAIALTVATPSTANAPEMSARERLGLPEKVVPTCELVEPVIEEAIKMRQVVLSLREQCETKQCWIVKNDMATILHNYIKMGFVHKFKMEANKECVKI